MTCVKGLNGKTVVLGVTGGIAAYKACEIVRGLKRRGADVIVVMTKNAAQFVAPLTFETLSNNRTVVDTFDRGFAYDVQHISISKRADLFLVAPCTANFIGKYASGIADDFLTTTALAVTCPVLLAPAMNTNMLHHAAVQQNISTLKARGVHIVDSATGDLACGTAGEGRLAEPNDIIDAAARLLLPVQDYAGKTLLITAGATEQPVDPVRVLTNRSSGKMGVALAKNALDRGAKVILVAGIMSAPLPDGVQTVPVRTTKEMYDAVMRHLKDADIIIKAAAPSDYTVLPDSQKIKSDTLTLTMQKAPDIAAAAGAKKGKRKLVIFCAETQNLLENAREKRVKKNADMVIANDVTMPGAGFETDTNIVTVLTTSAVEPLPLMQKTELAGVLLDRILAL